MVQHRRAAHARPKCPLSWTRDGFNKVKRHLDVDRFDADYRLDLHGKTVDNRMAIQQMLNAQIPLARLQIVHGIGRRSAEQTAVEVLRESVV